MVSYPFRILQYYSHRKQSPRKWDSFKKKAGGMRDGHKRGIKDKEDKRPNPSQHPTLHFDFAWPCKRKQTQRKLRRRERNSSPWHVYDPQSILSTGSAGSQTPFPTAILPIILVFFGKHLFRPTAQNPPQRKSEINRPRSLLALISEGAGLNHSESSGLPLLSQY